MYRWCPKSRHTNTITIDSFYFLKRIFIFIQFANPDVSPDQWRALQAMPIAIGADHLDIAIPSQWRDQEWQHLIDQLPDQHRTIRLHPAIEADLQQALATETDQPTKEPNPPTEDQSSNPAPAETASTLDLNAESFLHDCSPDEVLESEEDSDAQLARDAIDLEASLKDAEASPVVTLVDRILLQAMSVGASDIHVEPQQKGLRLRFRQDDDCGGGRNRGIHPAGDVPADVHRV